MLAEEIVVCWGVSGDQEKLSLFGAGVSRLAAGPSPESQLPFRATSDILQSIENQQNFVDSRLEATKRVSSSEKGLFNAPAKNTAYSLLAHFFVNPTLRYM